MTEPRIISSYEGGRHAADLEKTVSRLGKEVQYRDLSTIIIIPALESVPTRVVASWLNLMSPPNNKVARLFAQGMEVGAAYSSCIESILANEQLAQWKYIVTIEHDNLPPQDGLLKLLARAEERPEFTAIGGLYFTKGPGGVAQIWGDPNDKTLNFRPQQPSITGELVECCGLGMGFSLFRLEAFKDKRLRRPWFKTQASKDEGAFSQDLYFWHDARKFGHRCAVDCSVKTGHLEQATDIVW